MVKKTHLVAGVMFSLACTCSAPATVLVCAGALLPDIDKSTTTLGKKFKFISSFLKHRGFTHSLLFFILSSMISPYLGIGVLTHIILDMFNPTGVELLFPFGKKISFPIVGKWFVTGTVSEDVFRYVLYVLIAIIIIYFLLTTRAGYKDTLLLNWDQFKTNIVNIYNYYR